MMVMKMKRMRKKKVLDTGLKGTASPHSHLQGRLEDIQSIPKGTEFVNILSQRGTDIAMEPNGTRLKVKRWLGWGSNGKLSPPCLIDSVCLVNGAFLSYSPKVLNGSRGRSDQLQYRQCRPTCENAFPKKRLLIDHWVSILR